MATKRGRRVATTATDITRMSRDAVKRVEGDTERIVLRILRNLAPTRVAINDKTSQLCAGDESQLGQSPPRTADRLPSGLW